MTERKMIRRLSVVAAGMFLGLVFSVCLWRSRGGDGVLLVPRQIREPEHVVYFCQQDPAWADDHLGEARDTMASSGCLVCALASGLAMQAAGQGLSFELTAGELNEAFSEAEVYTESGAVIWGRIPLAVPGTESLVMDSVDGEEIARLLEDGIFPVVKVRMKGVGAWHWVLLTGSDANGYLCMDPMSDTKEAVSLSEFHNRAYAVRAVYFCE